MYVCVYIYIYIDRFSFFFFYMNMSAFRVPEPGAEALRHVPRGCPDADQGEGSLCSHR